MKPIHIGWVVHHKQTAVRQFKLNRINLSLSSTSSGIFVTEHKVSGLTLRQRRNGTFGNQINLIISVFTHVVLSILVPVHKNKVKLVSTS